MLEGQEVTAVKTLAIANPTRMPINPPVVEIAAASIKNWINMSLRRAPIAIRMPISFVLSVTATSMIFMTTMPPTKRAREEMAIMAI